MFGLEIFILAELSQVFFLCRSKSFLRALKGRSRTEDLGFKEILRRIYFKVCMFGFDSSTDCLLLSGSNLDASLTPQSKAALPDTAPTVRHHPTAPETRQPDSPTALTDSTCKWTHVLTDRQPRQPPTLHRPTPPDTTPTPSDDTRHHPKPRQPPSRKGLRGREAENARRGVRKVQHLARAGVRHA